MNMVNEQLVIDKLVASLSPFLIVLFGSHAKGTANQDSDIDIAFLSEQNKVDSYQLFMIAQDLAAKLNQEVDLIDLQEASTVFQAQVIQTGKVIYCSNQEKKQLFEIKTLKMYTKLNEERAPIFKKIAESGSIYEK